MYRFLYFQRVSPFFSSSLGHFLFENRLVLGGICTLCCLFSYFYSVFLPLFFEIFVVKCVLICVSDIFLYVVIFFKGGCCVFWGVGRCISTSNANRSLFCKNSIKLKFSDLKFLGRFNELNSRLCRLRASLILSESARMCGISTGQQIWLSWFADCSAAKGRQFKPCSQQVNFSQSWGILRKICRAVRKSRCRSTSQECHD